ncbi:hypothetical protein ACFQY0_14910 [Haloferula chungangensis]|uniref:Uncharacterized protein n=1 Tax=Haloferula chungangensis TaxID=1048331 RepID=A0ABW2L9Z3_9BACT
MERIHGAETWRVASDLVTLDVTVTGGMSTAAFRLGDRCVKPYSLSPWQPDDVNSSLPSLLKVLRGDFLCLPFGPQDDGPPHGASANEDWSEISAADDLLVIGMKSGDSGAKVEKEYRLVSGHSAIYYEFRISELEGKWSYGNHPILDCSSMAEGSARVSVSPFRWGSVYQGVFSNPEAGERQCLKDGATFDSLETVELADGGTADLTRWPSRKGFEDLVMMVNEPASDEQPFAWSAVVMDGYVWFSLKNPEDFPATLFWMSNGGRDGAPWDGRHLGRIGVEEVCSHFCDDVTRSREEALPGIPTVRTFDPNKKVFLRIVQAVAAVPEGFGRVSSITPAGDELVQITGENGASVECSVDWSHVL